MPPSASRDDGASPSRTALSLDDVTCRIGRRLVLEHVTFAVETGTIAGVLGPNGAGKSTLLALVTGLRTASGGTVTVLGERLPAGGALRRRIGVVLQETALYEELTARENLLFSASLYRLQDAGRRSDEVLELLGLAGRRDDQVRTLSGGLRRRLAIARALLHDPELLVIDEPTLGVDAEARHATWSHLRLLRSLQTTVLVASNYLDEVQALCDVAAVLRDGRIVAYESPDDLVARAGRCVDVECSPEVASHLRLALTPMAGVLRVDGTASGISVFLDTGATSDEIVRAIVGAASIGGLRVRPADLAEVFRALDRVS